MKDISLKKLLDEIKFDDNLKNDSNQQHFFNVGELKYRVDSNFSIMHNKKTKMEVKFYLLNPPNEPNRNNFQTYQQYNIALNKARTNITNTGNSFTVLSNVVTIIRNFIKSLDPDYITFIAGENSRQKLYLKLSEFFRKKTDIKYKQLDMNPELNIPLESDEFWFEKEQ
jgi:hypothetical protein